MRRTPRGEQATAIQETQEHRFKNDTTAVWNSPLTSFGPRGFVVGICRRHGETYCYSSRSRNDAKELRCAECGGAEEGGSEGNKESLSRKQIQEIRNSYLILYFSCFFEETVWFFVQFWVPSRSSEEASENRLLFSILVVYLVLSFHSLSFEKSPRRLH